MSKTEAREHFGAAPLYWHTSKHCWDATSKRSRKSARAAKTVNSRGPRPGDQQIEREPSGPVQSGPAPQTLQSIDQPKDTGQPNSREVAAEAPVAEPVRMVRSDDVQSTVANSVAVPQFFAHAWIFVAAACVVALWLILQSAEVFAPARLPSVMYQRWLFLTGVGRRLGRRIQRRRISGSESPPASAHQADPDEPTHVSTPAAPIPTPVPKAALAPVTKRRHADGRAIVPISELEVAIVEAVKNAAPGCEAFVGVIVQRKQPASPLEANWELCGKKFGEADRVKADEALSCVVKRMEKEFCLAEH